MDVNDVHLLLTLGRFLKSFELVFYLLIFIWFQKTYCRNSFMLKELIFHSALVSLLLFLSTMWLPKDQRWATDEEASTLT